MSSLSFKGYRIVGSHLHSYQDIYVKAYIIEPKPNVFMAQLCYYYNEKRVRKSFSLLSSTPKGREEEAYEYKDKLQKEIYEKIFKQEKHLFVDELKHYMNNIERINNIRDTSAASMRNGIKTVYKYGPFQDMYIEDIKTRDIQSFVDWCLSSGRITKTKKHQESGLSKSTVSFKIDILRMFFGYCIRIMEYIDKNPVDNIRIKYKNNDTPIEEDQYFTLEECKQILKYVRNNEKYCYPYYYVIDIALYYGLRKSEIFGLKWEDIDFDNNLVYIRNTVVSQCGRLYKQNNMTKSKSSNRVYPLLNNIRNDLLEVKDLHEKIGFKTTGNNYIFVHLYNSHRVENSSNLGLVYDPMHFNRCFKKIVGEADVNKDLHMHSLRHSTATLLKEIGFTAEQIADWLGHSSQIISRKYYIHDTIENKINIGDKIKNIFDI